MTRFKNAATEYWIGAIVPVVGDTVWLRLAKWIETVSDESDEEVEETAFYDGDGTKESDVTSVKKAYKFEGMYDETDLAMKFVADLELKTGDNRKIMFKQVRTGGKTLVGEATLMNPKTTGGPAEEHAPFECEISWNATPTVTP